MEKLKMVNKKMWTPLQKVPKGSVKLSNEKSTMAANEAGAK
jgi:hypothetical protein